jgi:hypothetical protein
LLGQGKALTGSDRGHSSNQHFFGCAFHIGRNGGQQRYLHQLKGVDVPDGRH